MTVRTATCSHAPQRHSMHLIITVRLVCVLRIYHGFATFLVSKATCRKITICAHPLLFCNAIDFICQKYHYCDIPNPNMRFFLKHAPNKHPRYQHSFHCISTHSLHPLLFLPTSHNSNNSVSEVDSIKISQWGPKS